MSAKTGKERESNDQYQLYTNGASDMEMFMYSSDVRYARRKETAVNRIAVSFTVKSLIKKGSQRLM